MVIYIVSFFFNLVEKNLLLVKKKFRVAKMASTVYESDTLPLDVTKMRDGNGNGNGEWGIEMRN